MLCNGCDRGTTNDSHKLTILHFCQLTQWAKYKSSVKELKHKYVCCARFTYYTCICSLRPRKEADHKRKGFISR